jgi:hypothetical protein
MPDLTTDGAPANSLDDRLVELLASGKTIAETAALVGRSTSTLYRRMQSPMFRARLSEARAGRLKPIADILADACDPAVDRLLAVIRDPDATHSVVVRAAETIITLALKLDEHANIAPRLAALEAVIAEQKADRGDADPEPDTLELKEHDDERS